jgi:arylsulfatase A-like enzyme
MATLTLSDTELMMISRALIAAGLLLTASATLVVADDAAKRPNFLWIVSEDNGPFLGCYGYPDAKTPQLDKLASQGILYQNAFSAAPVCAPSRCSLITGMYAPSLGTQHMRSTHFVPESITFFVKHLRDAGYFCTNNSKTDYNLSPVPKDAWNQITGGDHRKRAEGQPFFAVYNLGTSHESSLHKPVDESLTTADVTIPPYHPDTPEIRANWAMYHRVVTQMDRQVGDILRKLDEEGVADDTIVFYYSDHAGILPRSKRFLYDTGTHVPLIVRFGKNVQHLDPRPAGSRTDELVSLLDLGPTVLSLAGVELPRAFQGRPFLGEQKAKERDYVFTFRGRMDERYDFSRAVRDKRFKYIRNYNPHRIYGQPLEYLWKMLATRSWEAAFLAGKCNAAQSRFWHEKPAEELYDTSSDPWEVNNLASDPAHAKTLALFRAAHREHALEIRDSGFLPEAMMVAMGKEQGSIYKLVRDEQQYPLAELIDAAQLATQGDVQNLDRLTSLLAAEHPAMRYWGAVGLCLLKAKASPAKPQLLKLAEADTWPNVRIAAAEALMQLGEKQAALDTLEKELASRDPWAALHAANVLEVIGDDARPVLPAIRAASKSGSDYVKRATAHTVEKLSR